jgi:glycosyltransferase involved in cell wall biosynthesis
VKASIIIAAKNAEPFIHTALASALAQTLADLEVIVVNDGSSDGTGDVVRRFQRSDPRVILLENAQSIGVSAARNRGLDVARGDWIAVLDADDEFTVERLAIMVEQAEARSLDLLADNMLFRELGNPAPGHVAYPASWMADSRPLTLADLLDRDRPGSEHPMFGYIKPLIRRRFLLDANLRYREDVWCAEDFLLYAEAVLHGATFGVMGRPLYVRYWRAGSLSGDTPAVHQEISRVNRIVAAMARRSAPETLPALRQRQAELDYVVATRAARAGDLAMAARMALRVPLPVIAGKFVSAVRKRVGRRAAATSV